MSKAINRNYIQLYHDSLSILNKLSDEQAGILIKSIYKYSINGEIPILDFALDIAISPFINQIDRETERQSENAEIYRENGKKGGRPKAETKANQNNQSGYSETKITKANQSAPITTTTTTTITKNNNNNKKEKNNASSDAMLVIDYFNELNQTKNDSPKLVLDGLMKILEDYPLEEIKLVIDFMADSWYSKNGQNTLSALSRATRFFEKLEKARIWLKKKPELEKDNELLVYRCWEDPEGGYNLEHPFEKGMLIYCDWTGINSREELEQAWTSGKIEWVDWLNQKGV